MKNNLADNQLELENIEADNWGAISEKQYEILNTILHFYISQEVESSYINDQAISVFTIKATTEEKRILAETGIEPFIQWDTYNAYHPTIYDDFTGDVVELWERSTMRYGVPGFYFLYQIVQMLIIPFIILIGCFLFGNTISSESTKKRRGLNLYAALPLQKGKLFFAKYFSGLLFTALYFIFIMLVPLILSLFTRGIGSLQYPVLIYDGSENRYGIESTFLNDWTGEFHFITLGEYFIQVLPLALALILFVYSLYFLLSLFIKNPSVNAALIIIGTYIGMNFLPKHMLNPFSFVDVHGVINGRNPWSLQSSW